MSGLAARVAVPHVYIVLDRHAQFLYIGSTRNLQRRLAEHRRSAWADMERWNVVFAYASLDSALDDEAALIALAKPRFNTQSLGAVDRAQPELTRLYALLRRAQDHVLRLNAA